ncbi:Diaminohydroxyphosphoribosylaminopyrimidine deaminase / 5-amino-6-(5-phosphoribosylamino)uracil reductase [hydrothermal vent metagenome]|uniref:Diaminohydroxyphosphoribosylaminopyrimidine deaminase / 5-amino-6-(5-phosphoribosylamino)uracil reductase n=1 Tax=hydrothermal vent metagenome TaxID=652676 RepID=A0A3B0RQ25_9ZZZZ
MRQALRVAARGSGNTAENPAVGCVIVSKNNHLIGVGHTAASGRPHAETQALAMAREGAGEGARGATAYVTLEPCAHQGKTPPCATALIDAGVKRVVIATKDPDPRVSGKGIAMLEDAGIEAVTGILEEEARYQLRGFFSRILRNRPHVILKLAISADGKIAAGPGQRTQITGPQFHQRVHLLRARVDAIMVGAGTVRADKPSLTCRLPGLADRSPARVIIGGDDSLEIPKPAIHFKGLVDFNESLLQLAKQGINLLLVEGGAKIARSLLEAGLVDEVILATAPLEIGKEGVAALAEMSLSHIETEGRFVCKSDETVGQDVVKHYLRKR